MVLADVVVEGLAIGNIEEEGGSVLVGTKKEEGCTLGGIEGKGGWTLVSTEDDDGSTLEGIEGNDVLTLTGTEGKDGSTLIDTSPTLVEVVEDDRTLVKAAGESPT